MKRHEELQNFKSKKCKFKYTKGGAFIDYTSEPPSLQSIASVTIAIRLWTEPEIKQELVRYSQRYCFETNYYRDAKSRYNKLEEKVLKRLSKLPLPESLKLRVTSVMRPIVLQLLRCFDNRPCFYLLKIEDPHHWTVEGTIDRIESLKELINVKDGCIRLRTLFYLSCTYCLEECIKELWNRFSPVEKLNCSFMNFSDMKYKSHLVAYWVTVLINNDLSNLLRLLKQDDYFNIYDTTKSVYLNMVSSSVFDGNLFAVKYFWQKLTLQERNTHVNNWLELLVKNPLHNIFRSECFQYQECYDFTYILLFLLSNLSDESQQMEFFRRDPYFILKSLLYSWPFQRFFLCTITELLNSLDEKTYCDILSDILDQVRIGRTNELFREVWCHSPEKLKKAYLSNTDRLNELVWKFISVDDVDTIVRVFEDATSLEKYLLISKTIKNRQTLFDIMYFNKLHLLDKVAVESLSSDDFNYLRNFIMLEEADWLFHRLICKGAFQRAKELLDWGFESSEEIESFKRNKLNPSKLLYHLMYGDCENLNQFVLWYFKTNDAVCRFKKSFLLKLTASNEWEMILHNFSCRNSEHSWERFLDFITWCIKDVYTSRKISHFKKFFLKSIVPILKTYNFDFATKLLNWCFNSVDEVSQFKNKLIVSVEGMNLLLLHINRNYTDWDRIRDIIRWFSPLSDETVIAVNTLLNKKKNCKKNNLQRLHALLKSFSVNTSSAHKRNFKFLNDHLTIDLINNNYTDSEDDEDFIHLSNNNGFYYFI